MRFPQILVLLLCLAGCAKPPPPVVAPPPPPARPDSAAEAALRAADARRAAATATEARRATITATSHGRAPVVAARATGLRDAPALTAAILANIAAGDTLDAHAFDGRYWGVRYGEHWGYVHAASVARDVRAEQAVTASCADFGTRDEAQAAYDADPSAYSELDTDGDGRACERGVGASGGDRIPRRPP